jgi:hypothetical protein
MVLIMAILSLALECGTYVLLFVKCFFSGYYLIFLFCAIVFTALAYHRL